VTQGDAGDRSEVATSGSIFGHSQVYPSVAINPEFACLTGVISLVLSSFRSVSITLYTHKKLKTAFMLYTM
jgi:hypothetical protein